MKKLKLSELNLGSAEVLTREELKKVLGGLGSGSGSGGSWCFTCKENGEVVWAYGRCSGTTSCDSGTCKDYDC